jgi:gas vesicle protein
MGNNQKFIAGLILGAVAGAALIYFLNSDKGKQLITDVKEGSDKLQDDLTDKLHEFDLAVNDLLEKGKNFIDDFEQKAGEATS